MKLTQIQRPGVFLMLLSSFCLQASLINVAQAAPSATFDEIVAEYELAERSLEMSRYVPNSDAGKLLGQALTLSLIHTSPEKMRATQQQIFGLLRRHGPNTVAAIDAALKAVPASRGAERAFLISLLSQVTSDVPTRAALLEREAVRNSTDVDDDTALTLNAAFALQTLSDLEGPNSARVERVARSALSTRTARPAAQEILVHQVDASNPLLAQRLRTDFKIIARPVPPPVVVPVPSPR